MTRFIFIFLSVITNSTAAQLPDLGKQLSAIRTGAGITGLQAVYQRGERITCYHDGYSSTESKSGVTDTTVFQAASLSKVVLAYTVMRLYDRGLISLDKPLYDYYAYPRINKDSNGTLVTARMVLSHTSGFPNWAVGPGSKQWKSSKLNTKFKPGTAWSYSGEGFVFLQLVIENLLGKSLNDIASKEVFEPLHMTRSSFVWQPRLEASMAYGHEKNNEENPRSQSFVANGAASLITTATDYNLFLHALINGEGLKPGTKTLMLSKAAEPDWYGQPKNRATPHLGWGLGVGLEENEYGKAIWHWGDNGDFKCFFIAFPKKNESLVVFTNDERGLNVMEKVFTLFFGKAVWWPVIWLD